MSAAAQERPAPAAPASAPVTVSADVSAEEWDAYVAGHVRGTFCHRWAWRRVFHAAFGHRTEYLAARDAAGRVRGVLPLVVFEHRVFGRFMVSLPFVNHGGVLADSDDEARALITEAAARGSLYGSSHVELRHTTPVFEHLPRRSHKVSMTMSLPETAEAAWNGLDRKVRNQVRKAEKSGFVCAVGGAELLPHFYAVFAETMRDLGTPVYPSAWFAEILKAFPAEARLVVVRDGAKPVAAGLTLTANGILEVPSAGSLRAYRVQCPNMLLYWRIMQLAIEQRCATLDFGRSTPDEGTFKFKEQWGARPGPLTWEYVLLSRTAVPDRSPKNARFQQAIAAWKRLPLSVANRVGPAIVRYLP